MGADDDTDCAHVWRLTGVALERGGAHSEYACVRPACEGVLLVGPDDIPPGTV